MSTIKQRVRGYISEIRDEIALAEDICRKKHSDAIDIDSEAESLKVQSEAFFEMRTIRRIKATIEDLEKEISNLPELKTYKQKESSLLTPKEFTQRVGVQNETVEYYIKKGKIVPDQIVPGSGNRVLKLLKEDKVELYAKKFG